MASEIGKKVHEVPTPAVIVDLDIVERNLVRMAEYCRSHGIALRPDTKIHKTIEAAQRQLALGAIGLTVAKVGEAEVMVASRAREILVANPIVGDDKLRRLAALTSKVRIIVAVDSLRAAPGLSKMALECSTRFDVLVEFDSGSKRCGVVAGEPAAQLGQAIAALRGVRLCGVFTYFGSVWGEESERIREMEKAREDLNKFDPLENSWQPISECPFSIWDLEDDDRTDVTSRVSATPLNSLHRPETDSANNYAYTWAREAMPAARIGALNMRLSVAIRARYEMDANQEIMHCHWGITRTSVSRTYEIGAGILSLPKDNNTDEDEIITTTGVQEQAVGRIVVGISYARTGAKHADTLVIPGGGNKAVILSRKLSGSREVSGEYTVAAAWSGGGWPDPAAHVREVLAQQSGPSSAIILGHETNPDPEALEAEPK